MGVLLMSDVFGKSDILHPVFDILYPSLSWYKMSDAGCGTWDVFGKYDILYPNSVITISWVKDITNGITHMI